MTAHFNTGRVRSGDPATRKPTLRDLEWAAGFYEGEGTVNLGDDRSFQLSIVQNNPEPLQRCYALFGGRAPYIYRSAKGNRKDCWRWYVSGVRARGVAMTLYALLSQRRRARIAEALRGRGYGIGPKDLLLDVLGAALIEYAWKALR